MGLLVDGNGLINGMILHQLVVNSSEPLHNSVIGLLKMVQQGLVGMQVLKQNLDDIISTFH